MPDDLDRHEDEVDDTLDDVESVFADLRDSTQDNIDEAIDQMERQRRVLERMGEQDMVKALRDIERHYKTDYDDPSQARQAEDDIDAVVARHEGYPAPFSDVGLQRVDVYDGWFGSKTRRNFMAGVAGLFVTGAVASDAGNYADEDTPDRGGARLPFGSGDIDGWGALEDHRAAEGKPPTGGQKPEPTDTPTEAPGETSTPTSSGSSDYRIVTASVNSDQIGNYLEGLTRVERDEWEPLWNAYDPAEGEFYPNSDLSLARVEIEYLEDPSEASNYTAITENGGREIRQDPVEFEHDETAREALEYFGELDE